MRQESEILLDVMSKYVTNCRRRKSIILIIWVYPNVTCGLEPMSSQYAFESYFAMNKIVWLFEQKTIKRIVGSINSPIENHKTFLHTKKQNKFHFENE